jgi:uncharacterized protein (DUF1778 family)
MKKTKPNRRRLKIITVRVDDAEMDAIKARANVESLSVTAFARRAAVMAASRPLAKQQEVL